MNADQFPKIFDETRFYRIAEIVGDPNAAPPITGRLPIPRSTWYQRVAEGVIPPGTRLSPRIVAWHGAVLNDVAARLSMTYADVRFGPVPGTSQRRPVESHANL